MQKTILNCLIDKEYPPEHSFVDGMLASEMPRADLSVRLFTSKGASSKSVVRYKRSICLPVLWKRKGILRFFNFLCLFSLLSKMIYKDRIKNRKIIIFVRNEPIYLLVGYLLRKKVDRLIFQQSFPHEINPGTNIKGRIAMMIFRSSASRVDAILAVSPIGLRRLRGYFGDNPKGIVIPLLGGIEHARSHHETNFRIRKSEPLKFIYAGAHSKIRNIELLLRSLVLAYRSNIYATFFFLGGEEKDIERLRNVGGVRELELQGLITFCTNITRENYFIKLREHHVGLSVIPPIPLYKEASPSKLADYMFNGLAVIASRGIEMQDIFIQESRGGILVNWEEDDLAQAIIGLCNKKDLVVTLRKNAYEYACRKLKYKDKTDQLMELLQ